MFRIPNFRALSHQLTRYTGSPRYHAHCDLGTPPEHQLLVPTTIDYNGMQRMLHPEVGNPATGPLQGNPQPPHMDTEEGSCFSFLPTTTLPR